MKLIKRIYHWEFIDLDKVLVNQEIQPKHPIIIIEGQLVALETPAKSQKKTTGINDILSRVQAFSRFMAVLLAADATHNKQGSS